MRCYICNKPAVASRGGLMVHYGLCRKHFNKGGDWFFEQRDEIEDEEIEEYEEENQSLLETFSPWLLFLALIVIWYFALSFFDILAWPDRGLAAFVGGFGTITIFEKWQEWQESKNKPKKRKRR